VNPIRVALHRQLDEDLARLQRRDGDALAHPGGSDPDMDAVASSQDAEVTAQHREVLLDRVRQIREAFGRLDDGTWGTCTSCGEPIADRRLVAYPWAPTCVACATQDEVAARRAAYAAAPEIRRPRGRPRKIAEPVLEDAPVDELAGFPAANDPGEEWP
jgi:DnaK suppressor protein